MHFFETTRQDEHRAIPNNQFPRIFAICKCIYPRPQFQLCNLIEIGTTNIYTLINNREPLNEDYRVGGLNLSLESEYYFENRNNHDTRRRYKHGDIEIMRTMTSRHNLDSYEVRFEIRNLYLVNDYNEIPIVLFQTNNLHDLYPQPNILITPINMPELHHTNTIDLDSNRATDIREFLIIHHNDIYIRDIHETRQNRREYFGRIMNYDNYRRNLIYDAEYVSDRPFTPSRTRHRERRRTMPRNSIGAGAGAGGGVVIPEYYNWPNDEDIIQTAGTLMNLRSQPASNTTTTNTTSSSLQQNSRIILQSFTIKALIDHAITEKMTCPISLNPIEKSSACVTTCQHIFNRENIEQWLADHSTCPVCRQETQICEISNTS